VTELKVLVDGYTFFECPRWRDGRLWLSDFYTETVIAVTPDGQVEDIAHVAGQPSGLGWLPDGRLLIVSMKDQKILRQEADGSLVEHADLSGVATGHLNDMVVDSAGRAYVGNFGFDLMAGETPVTTTLIRVDPDGTVSVAADGLAFPNGTVITPDGATMILSESFGNRLSAFSVGADGSLGERRDWATFGPLPAAGLGTEEIFAGLAVAPDGIGLDAEGAIWVADALHDRVIRVREGGEITDEIQIGMGAYACMLGGPEGRTLYACAAPSFAEHERRDTRDAVLLAATV
jgi:sugar lactone lactonase YvrE